MPRTLTDLLLLAASAQAFLESKGLDPAFVPEWMDLPRFPPLDGPGLPVWSIPTPALNLRLGSSPEATAADLRRKHDPDEVQPWVFVPSPLNAVWLVRVKRTSVQAN